MARVPIDKTMRMPDRATPGARLYVRVRDDTTQVSVYNAAAGGSVQTQPLTSDSEGRFPDRWVAPGSYDLYSPDDAVEPTQPWEAALGLDPSAYSVIAASTTHFQDTNTAATYILGLSISTVVSTNSALGLLNLDPADFAVAGLTTKYRLQASCATNTIAPAANFTVGLYPVTAVGGGADAGSVTLGAVTTGSTIAFTAPSASTLTAGTATDFAAPAAGHFVVGCILSATQTADARTTIAWQLQVRNV